MIGTLARKRMHMRVSHLAAVATLVALLGAMFVAMGSVGAQTATACPVDADITLNKEASCTLDLKAVHEDADGLRLVSRGVDDNDQAIANLLDDPDVTANATSATAELTAQTSAGNQHVEVTMGSGEALKVLKKIRVTVTALGITKIEVDGDSDGVVKAGDPVMLKVTSHSASAAARARLTVPTTGLSIDNGSGGTTQRFANIGAPAEPGIFTFNIITDGAPNGTYTLTVVIDDNGFTQPNATDGTQDKDAKGTFDLTVGAEILE